MLELCLPGRWGGGGWVRGRWGGGWVGGWVNGWVGGTGGVVDGRGNGMKRIHDVTVAALPACNPVILRLSCKLSTRFPRAGAARFHVSSTSTIPVSGFIKLHAKASASN